MNSENSQEIAISGSIINLRKSYLILFIISIVSISASFISYVKNNWLSNLLLDVGSGIIGSLIIIFLLDRIIDIKSEQEKSEIRKIALRRLASHAKDHIRLFENIYKASTKEKPESIAITFKDLFNDDFYQGIRFLGFAEKAPIIPSREWGTYISENSATFVENIEKIIDAYSIYLGINIIDKLENLSRSSFIHYVGYYTTIRKVDKEGGFKRTYALFHNFEDGVKEHINILLEIINIINNEIDFQMKPSENLSRDDVSPQWSSGRINI